jgi:hypothetical protein
MDDNKSGSDQVDKKSDPQKKYKASQRTTITPDSKNIRVQKM